MVSISTIAYTYKNNHLLAEKHPLTALKLDILAFGAHPDDIELSCGGTLITHKSKGYKVGLVDLTRGELGTRGTPELRDDEAQLAAQIIGAEVRENLQFRDGFFINDELHQLAVIAIIRKYQPEVILANALYDRHPDHGRAAELVAESAFLAGLRRIETTMQGMPQQAWRPRMVLHYTQHIYHKPSVVVDISEAWERKMECIMVHKSQFFDPDSTEPYTMISDAGYMDYIKGRHMEFGTQIGVKYGEGFVLNRSFGVSDLMHTL